MAVMMLILFMQSYDEFMKKMNETWTELELEDKESRRYDLQDALRCYDTMWLGALALDSAEKKLQIMNPSMTLDDFNYTGNHSKIIKDVIYESALEVNFTGATVSDHQ